MEVPVPVALALALAEARDADRCAGAGVLAGRVVGRAGEASRRLAVSLVVVVEPGMPTGRKGWERRVDAGTVVGSPARPWWGVGKRRSDPEGASLAGESRWA